ncbi:MAG: heme ABC exporter ATP-binding protein CcmA [Thermoplasmata archaeon]
MRNENRNPKSVAIESKNLTKKFGSTVAIRDLNLKIEPARISALFGPNGAGKTTLIRILSTLTRPTSGRVLVDGLDMSSDGREIRSRIGVVLHDPLLYDDLSAAENLRFYCRMYGSPDSRIDELLSLFGLRHRRNDRVATLSSGMVKRLSLARAMIHNPEILILDEPFSGLDTDSTRKLMSLLDTLRNEGTTVVLATHHLDEGFPIGDRLLVLRKGKLVLDKKKRQITANEFKSTYGILTEA